MVFASTSLYGVLKVYMVYTTVFLLLCRTIIMSVSSKYILYQGPVIGAFLHGAVGVAKQNLFPKTRATTMPPVPGPIFEKTTAPLPDDLLNDYIRKTGGETSWYKGVVPAHLFPQWCFPLSQKTLDGLPYPIEKVMNGGCRLEIHGAIPRGEKLVSTAQLANVDDNGSRAVITQEMTSGTAAHPELIHAKFYPIVPLGKGGGGGKKKAPKLVPDNVREVARWRFDSQIGMDFAKLTGDFNPIHWVPSYAKAFGFRGCIVHGFATMAFAIEAINKNILGGDIQRLAMIDVQFTRPLHYPATVSLYTDDKGTIYVGNAPGGPAFLIGKFETR